MQEIGLDMSDYGDKGYKVTINHCFRCKKFKIVYIINTVKLKTTGQVVKSKYEVNICQPCAMKEVTNG